MPDEMPPDGRDPDSTFSKVMNTPVAQSNTQVAVLLTFERGTTVADVEKLLEQINNSQHFDIKIREFDPTLGGYPVIYFP